MGTTFSAQELKVRSRTIDDRCHLLMNKRNNEIRINKKKVAHLLSENQDESARFEALSIMRAERMLIAYRLLALAGKHISDCTTSIANSSTCPSDVIDAVSCVIYAAPRLSEVTELAQVTQLLGAKYGEQFVQTYRSNKNGTVNESLIRCFSEPDLSYDDTVTYLKRVASEYSVDWEPLTGKDPEVLGTMKPFPIAAGGTVPPAPDMSSLPLDDNMYVGGNGDNNNNNNNTHGNNGPNYGGSGHGGQGYIPPVDRHADDPSIYNSNNNTHGGAQPYYPPPSQNLPPPQQQQQQIYVPSIYPSSHLTQDPPQSPAAIPPTHSPAPSRPPQRDDGLNKEEDLPPAYEPSDYPPLYGSSQTTTSSSAAASGVPPPTLPPPGVYDSNAFTGAGPTTQGDEDDLIARLSSLNPKKP